jgi:serine/threonine protein kinase
MYTIKDFYTYPPSMFDMKYKFEKSEEIKIGSGSYGQVYKKSDNTIVKKVDRLEENHIITALELTSICEIAVLSKGSIRNIPKLSEITMSSDKKKYLIEMENCGKTLLETAKNFTFQERVKMLPWIAFQLIETALQLQENGIIHNDIKSANVMVTDNFNVKLIDFGISSFETLGKISSDYIAEKETSISKEWGTYCICPPEVFMSDTWSVDKYMSWSIGITLCEFLFATHSFIYNYVLTETEQRYYKLYYKKDDSIKQILASFYINRINDNQKYVFNFKKFEDIPSNINDILSKLLTLNHQTRSSLNDVMKHSIFNRFKTCNNKKMNYILPEVIKNSVEQPIIDTTDMIDKFKYNRGTAFQAIFDFYDVSKKLALFTTAVNLFDRYCAKVALTPAKLTILTISCAYLAQYMRRRQSLTVNTTIISMSRSTNISVKKNHVSCKEVVNMCQDILEVLKYDIYRVPFDVLLIKEGLNVDMTVILNILSNHIGPYDNKILTTKYIDMMY